MGKPIDYPEPMRELIAHLKRLPGIGPRSAERLALWIQGQPGQYGGDLAAILRRVQDEVATCRRCGFFAEGDQCALCLAVSERAPDVLCVVEQPTDVLPVERTGAYRGSYHVLGGRLSPLNHVGPDDLRIEALLRRLQVEPVRELILALSNDVEGEATANYIAELLAGTGLLVTRLAQGLPMGGGLDTADQLTLLHALNRRQAWADG